MIRNVHPDVIRTQATATLAVESNICTHNSRFPKWLEELVSKRNTIQSMRKYNSARKDSRPKPQKTKSGETIVFLISLD